MQKPCHPTSVQPKLQDVRPHTQAAVGHTPLHEIHQAYNAKMGVFAGFALPLFYQDTGAVQEHKTVRARAGLFDVSHMGQLHITGYAATALVDSAVVSDIRTMPSGSAKYTLMCTDTAGIIDDVIVYKDTDTQLMICTNAARTQEDLLHLQQCAEQMDSNCADIQNLSDATALLALQGPACDTVLQALAPQNVSLATMAAFTHARVSLAGIDVRLARTGYTGESGCELFCRAQDAPALWQAVHRAGQPHGLVACGLVARDTLRLEMGFPLYGQDMTIHNDPISASLGWTVAWHQATAFCGRQALHALRQNPRDSRLTAIRVKQRGIARKGCAVLADNTRVGTVTSGTFSPSLGDSICLAYIPRTLAKVGQHLHIEVRGKQLAAQVVKRPFLRKDQT